jgi:hypothetical protein
MWFNASCNKISQFAKLGKQNETILKLIVDGLKRFTRKSG